MKLGKPGHDSTAGPARFALLFTLSMAQFTVVLDFTIVNVALPLIRHGLYVATGRRHPAGHQLRRPELRGPGLHHLRPALVLPGSARRGPGHRADQ